MSQEILEKIIAQQAATIQNLTDEIKLLREQVTYLTHKRYGRSSEQMPLNGQTSLFDEPNAQNFLVDAVQTITYKRTSSQSKAR